MVQHQPSWKVVSQQMNTSRLKDILASFTNTDLRIVCRDGHSISTSTLLFVISSSYVRSILAEVFERRSRLDEEPVTIFLSDFDVSSVDGVIQCMQLGEFTAKSQDHMTEMEELMSVLKLGYCQTQPSAIKIPILIKPEMQPTVVDESENDLLSIKNTIIEKPPPPTEVEVQVDDVIWNPGDDGDLFETFCPSTKQEATDKNAKKNRKRRQSEDFGDEDELSENACDLEANQSPTIPTNNKKAKRNGCGNKRALNYCPVCLTDNKSLQGIFDHFLMLVDDSNYKLKLDAYEKSYASVFYCPVCNDRLRSTHKMKQHFQNHLEEAHQRKTYCKDCERDFYSVRVYMEHLQIHNKKIRGKNYCSIRLRTLSRNSKTTCVVCGHDPSTLQDSIKHFLDLIGDPTFPLSRQKDRCFVCDRNHLKDDHAKMSHMRVHFQEAHINPQKARNCEQCHAKCPSLKEYLMHQREHVRLKKMKSNYNLKQCSICQKMIKSMSFGEHFNDCERKAKNEYLFCETCPFKTLSKSVLYAHQQRNHTEDGGLKWACEVCPKKFFRRFLRDRHQAQHSQERNFICDVCPSRFPCETLLHQHQKLHLQLYRYECKKCLQKFKNRKHTNRHILIHSDVPCWMCTACNKTFKNESAGTTHRKNVHDNRAQITMINTDYVNELFETCVREIEGTEVGNTRFKKMRGSNLEAAAKLADLVKEEI